MTGESDNVEELPNTALETLSHIDTCDTDRRNPSNSGRKGRVWSLSKQVVTSTSGLGSKMNYSAHLASRYEALFRDIQGLFQFFPVLCSPHQCLTRLRIEQVKTILRAHSNSLIDMALEYGSSSHAHLAKTFRKIVGVTPSDYRHIHEVTARTATV